MPVLHGTYMRFSGASHACGFGHYPVHGDMAGLSRGHGPVSKEVDTMFKTTSRTVLLIAAFACIGTTTATVTGTSSRPLVFQREFSVSQVSHIRGAGTAALAFHQVSGSISEPITESRAWNWSLITIPGLSYCVNPGAPLVPQCDIVLTFEGLYKDIDVALQSGTVKTAETRMGLLPSHERKTWAPDARLRELRTEDQLIYNTDDFYPGHWISYTYGYDGTHTNVYIHLFPIQWNPKTRELLFLSEYLLSIGGTKGSVPQVASTFPTVEARHIVLMPGAWASLAESLEVFHNSLGTTTQAVSIESIYSHYEPAEDPSEPGFANLWVDHLSGYEYENAKRIVAYLRDTPTHPFLEQVTILGSAGIVPASYYFCYWDDFEGWIPSDHYYASPDYDWIDNFSVTRIAADNLNDATTYYGKIEEWVTHLDEPWVYDASVAGGKPFFSHYYIGEMGNNQVICDGLVTGCSIEKFQGTRGTFSNEPVVDHLQNDDFLWHFHISHGNGRGIVFDDGSMPIDVIHLVNYPPKARLPVFLTVACGVGAFDTDVFPWEFPFDKSFAEALLASEGVAIALIGGSRSNGGYPEFCFSNGNLVYLGVEDTYALLYYYLEAYADVPEPTLGKLFREAKHRFLSAQNMDSPYNRAAFVRFVALCDAALPLPNPAEPNQTEDLATISLQNSVAGITEEYQVVNLTAGEDPTYSISNLEDQDLLTVLISENDDVSEQHGIQGSFSLEDLSVNQFILNRLCDGYEREAWHYSMVTRFEKEIDGDLADWTENELVSTDDAGDVYPDEFDLTGLYLSYDAGAGYLHAGFPVHLEDDVPEDLRYYYVLAFDDNPTGIENNYEADDPLPFWLWLFCGFENARINKLVSISIPEWGYDLCNKREYSTYASGSWGSQDLLEYGGIAFIGETAIEVSLPASALDLEACRMAVFSSVYDRENDRWGIMTDAIPTSPDGPPEPLFGEENAYSITSYVDISDIDKPSVPLNFQLHKETSSVTLSWHPPAGLEGLEAYRIYRNEIELGVVPLGQTVYTDAILEDGMHSYRIAALYETGEGELSSQRTVVFGNAALAFDGESTYGGRVVVPPSEVLDITEELTVEAWIRPTGWNTSSPAKIVDKQAFALFLKGSSGPNNSNCLLFRSYHGTGPGCFTFTPENSVVLDAWHHVAVTYHAAANSLAVYINGIEQDLSFTTQPSGSFVDNGDAGLTIGGSTNTTLETFDGDIDEVRIWNAARSHAEIVQSMGDSLQGDEAGLVANWRFDEAEGYCVFDQTVFGNTGECFNVTWVGGFQPSTGTDHERHDVPLPKCFDLAQNHPNPFSSETTIHFATPKAADVRIGVYDLSGRLIRTLCRGRQQPGYHVLSWKGENEEGQAVPPGLYICRMNAGEFSKTRKILLIR